MAPSNFKYDPEFAAFINQFEFPPPPKFKDVVEVQIYTNDVASRLKSDSPPIPEHILHTKIPFETHDATILNLHRFTQANKAHDRKQPAVLFIHGGGMVASSVELTAHDVASQVDLYGLDFFAVEYRLAPKQTGPYLTEDVYFGLKHLSEHAGDYNIDNKRIAVMGISAGGGLAAATVLLARDRALEPPIAKQILVYPMLDDRTRLPDDSPYSKFLVWTENANKLSWDAVLGKDVAGDPSANVSIYAAPGRATDLRGLPPAYIEVGQLDLFLNEDIAYASKLAANEVQVELHVWPGLPHAFELASNISLVKQSIEAKRRALRMI
ncbi:hypothetical protein CkaCkLH20_08140 [Colletotrichum karsti]|uniref:Alpha/beta hydrolase fold-3 domain-containing protein n=1 Tax=Colletotrichum karsti TaxID=1095194 RepID=A0A9P6LJI0_9PEZI|nr:uncharacterized protein CkaCkLH20_08140 [Colletotrichum karsti]KAF9874577.1 hypothetical protein CkaCkLH20_08140 [Colletotrichum karsti]